MKLLLHTCCAPCSVQCIEALGEEGIMPELLWYNPNIHPFTEYRSRKEALILLARDKQLSLTVEDDYGLRSFVKAVFSFQENSLQENSIGESAEQPACGVNSRCAYCYSLRMEKTACLAAEKGCDAFSTTLLISPYQNHELIRKTGEDLAVRYGIQFLYRDFRQRFREGQKQAREAGYYMQKYCGCIYSEEERYLGLPDKEKSEKQDNAV